ncbi:MAG: hypothetical protein HY530_03720 [Chloroflexi bacterium]|nr:hypothetical protein [Chloroflexota bacterium]
MSITEVRLNIGRNEVCQRLGYKDRTPPASILSLIDAQIARASELIKPVFTYDVRTIESVAGQEVFLAGHLALSSKTVSYVLSDCRRAFIYLATIGREISEETLRLIKKGEALAPTILDVIGTEAVAQTVTRLRGAAGDIAVADGYRATVQYAPGYCDWHVTQQKVLFQVINSGALGVTLTDSCFMVPEKSVSGVIGIGKIDPAKPPPCLAICDKRDSCSYKRMGWDPEQQSLL